MLVCAPADQIKSCNSRWLSSEPKINVAKKIEDSRFYEVVIDTSYLEWLDFLGYKLNLNYNPAAPTKENILIHGTWEATKIAQTGFLHNAVNEIRS